LFQAIVAHELTLEVLFVDELLSDRLPLRGMSQLLDGLFYINHCLEVVQLESLIQCLHVLLLLVSFHLLGVLALLPVLLLLDGLILVGVVPNEFSRSMW
jgi:hypothetical protein